MVFKPEREIAEILMLMIRDFQTRLDRDFEDRGVRGIGARHQDVFLHLAYFGPSRAVKMAEVAGIRPQSMMKAVHELEERGLVRREPDPLDSRAKLIHFSNAGWRLIEELRESTEIVWDQYTQIIDAEELTSALSTLRKLVEINYGPSKSNDIAECIDNARRQR